MTTTRADRVVVDVSPHIDNSRIPAKGLGRPEAGRHSGPPPACRALHAGGRQQQKRNRGPPRNAGGALGPWVATNSVWQSTGLWQAARCPRGRPPTTPGIFFFRNIAAPIKLTAGPATLRECKRAAKIKSALRAAGIEPPSGALANAQTTHGCPVSAAAGDAIRRPCDGC